MGTLFVAAEQGMILKSYDGENWTYVDTGYKGSFWTGIVLNNGTLLVGGLRGTIYRSTDDGRSWREAKSGFKSSITDFAEAGGKVYAAALDGVFLESDDHGATFTGEPARGPPPLHGDLHQQRREAREVLEAGGGDRSAEGAVEVRAFRQDRVVSAISRQGGLA